MSPQLIKLPQFTFLAGPSGVGKTTLAERLSSSESSRVMMSFRAPIRSALLATYFPQELFSLGSLDFRAPEAKSRSLPISVDTPCDCNDWMERYSDFLYNLHGSGVLGQLALREVEAQLPFYDSFIFDDFENVGDLVPFTDKFGKQNCCILVLSRPGFTSSPRRAIPADIPFSESPNDGSLEDLVAQFLPGGL